MYFVQKQDVCFYLCLSSVSTSAALLQSGSPSAGSRPYEEKLD